MWRGSFVLLATVGLGSLRPSPAGWKRWGRGHPVSSASRLNGPTAGCVPVEAVAYASGPSLAGRGRRVAQNWGAPGAAGSCGRLEGCGLRLGLLPCTSPPARGPAEVWVLAACQGAPGLLSAFERVGLPTPGSSAHAASRGLCCALLACLSRVNLVNRPDLLPRLNA